MDLRLNLKAQLYDMIESGVKREEYREIKPYWLKRLTTVTRCNKEEYQRVCDNLTNYNVYFKKYDTVTFVYGYTKRQMTFKCEDIYIDTGEPAWGAEFGTEYFVIKIGERLK